MSATFVGVKYNASNAGFTIPYPVGMNPTTVTCESTTVDVVDLVTGTNYTGISLSSVEFYKIGPGLAQIVFVLGTNNIPTNHAVRFSGTSPKIVLR